MKYLKFPGVDYPVSVIGVGLGLGNAFAELSPIETYEKAVRVALDLGATHIDTAEVYGGGRSEEMIGSLKGFLPNDVLVATKIGPANLSRGNVLRAIEMSLARLNRPSLDLLYVHWPNPLVPFEETAEQLMVAVNSGKVRRLGVSNFSLDEIVDFSALLPHGTLSAVQSEYNLFDRSAEHDLIPYCLAHRLAFVAYSPLDQGNIAGGEDARKLLTPIAADLGATISQLALSWLAMKSKGFLIPSTSSPARMLENCQAVELQLTEEVSERVDGATSKGPEQISARKIMVTSGAQRRQIYTTLESAIENRLGLSPSAEDLARGLSDGKNLKPVRVRRLKSTKGLFEFELVEGMTRYWAHVVAFGDDCLVPALVR